MRSGVCSIVWSWLAARSSFLLVSALVTRLIRPSLRAGSEDLRDRAQGHDEPEPEDDECAEGGERANESAVEGDTAEGPARENRDEPDRRHGEREPDTEGDDQQ